jgi:hypothetical protein
MHTNDTPSAWLDRARRWLADGRHVRNVLVGLALAMSAVLLTSYYEVLQAQVARADRNERVAEAGVVKPQLQEEGRTEPARPLPSESRQAR